MIAVLALSFAVLLLGNGVLAASVEALRETYVEHVSGDMSVAAEAEGNFTIFGSSQLLVGQYIVPPTIVEFGELREEVQAMGEVRASAGLLSSAARVRIGGKQEEQILFGVDFERYREMFPELELVAGSFPEPGERGIVVQQSWPEDVLGKNALLQVAYQGSFTLRGVPVTGIFRYPVADEALESVALVDPETARSLNGYIRGSVEAPEVPEDQQELLESDLEGMFGGAGAGQGGEAPDQTDGGVAVPGAADGGGPQADGGAEEPAETAEEGGIDPTAPLGEAASREEAEAARETISGAWNFLLISLADGAAKGDVARQLGAAGFTEEAGYLIRDWRDTVGGNAQIVTYLQLLFNVGLLFVAFGAAIITTNALVLSVLERTREIGTMRALGASKPRVAAQISLETLFLVVGSAVLGLVLGWMGTEALNARGITVDNRYFRILFGGEPIQGTVSARLLLWHLAASVGLAAVAVLYPLKRALSIQPVEAMAE
jgi:ABC-type lipoprotein release transport system permease subunit